jgi:excisionase family DNA binding protein
VGRKPAARPNGDADLYVYLLAGVVAPGDNDAPEVDAEAGSVTERLYTARQIAEVLGVAPGTILDWWEQGRIPGFKFGRAVRFDLAEVLEAGRPDAGRNVLANHLRPVGSRLGVASEPKEERSDA